MPSTPNFATESNAPAPAAVSAGWRWAPAWVLAYVALWPAPGYAEAVLVLGALVAIFKLVASRFRGGAQLLSNHAWALTSVLFCAYWFPELVSAFDAVDRLRALREAAGDLRYLPFLWLAASAVANARGRRITFGGLAIIVAVWTLDALMEVASGTSPLFFGIDALKQAISHRPMCPPRRSSKPTASAACSAPATSSSARCWPVCRRSRSTRRPAASHTLGWLLAAAPWALVIMLTGSRALVDHLHAGTGAVRLAPAGLEETGGVFAGGAIALVVLTWTSPQVRDRIERTTYALNADEQGVDTALSGRGRIWGAALCMAREHPFNGVGARGFARPSRPAIPIPASRPPGARDRRCTRTRSCWKC